MREIKFRAWDKVDKKVRKVMSLDFYNTRQSEATLASDGDVYFRYFEQVELMQYTGLKDKNGKEIFEGDIVHWKDCEPIDDEMVYEDIFVIYWSDEFLTWKAKNKDANDIDLYDISDNRELEIIGNIYENQEFDEVEDE